MWKILQGLCSSGPLAACLFVGVCGYVVPVSNYGPGHAALFNAAPAGFWAMTSLSTALLGYAGLIKSKQSWWVLAHGLAAVLLASQAMFFTCNIYLTGSGAPFFVAIASGLALNAWVRSIDSYTPPFVK